MLILRVNPLILFVQYVFSPSESCLLAYLSQSRAQDASKSGWPDVVQLHPNDKDEFPVIGVQDSKYLPLCYDEPARKQLHFVTSEKLLPTICSDSSSEHH